MTLSGHPKNGAPSSVLSVLTFSSCGPAFYLSCNHVGIWWNNGAGQARDLMLAFMQEYVRLGGEVDEFVFDTEEGKMIDLISLTYFRPEKTDCRSSR